MAEWLRRGLQILLFQFDSGRGLHKILFKIITILDKISVLIILTIKLFKIKKMLKKILQKLGLIKDNTYEEQPKKNEEQTDITNKETKKENKNSNTPDDIYPLW